MLAMAPQLVEFVVALQLTSGAHLQSREGEVVRVDVDRVDGLRSTTQMTGDAAAGAGNAQHTRRFVDLEEFLIDLGVLEQHVVDEQVSKDSLERCIRDSHGDPVDAKIVSTALQFGITYACPPALLHEVASRERLDLVRVSGKCVPLVLRREKLEDFLCERRRYEHLDL